MGWWRYYKPARPREVKGGLKTRRRRGEIGETWWAKRFLEILDSFGWSNRLARGRNYARRGQVIECNIGSGHITARVQGTRRRPYLIEIAVKTLSAAQWRRVIKAMASQAKFTAKLLAGEMPDDIELLFNKAKVPLFPSSGRDFTAECSCPDWANPCKHIAAVYYIVGEAFDRDPFLIFHLRGKERKELLADLNKIRGVKRLAEKKPEPKKQSIEPLVREPSSFWGGDKRIECGFSFEEPPLNASLLHRLGVPKFWMGTEKDFYRTMERVYSSISKEALRIAYRSDET
ncbi:MAG TPA: hypothetical protein EYP58_02765 [bacterium (Candidatus Stahlbacteria)]|nr:hypothetical protein [Candidatus Stahlbacteria bacterium]